MGPIRGARGGSFHWLSRVLAACEICCASSRQRPAEPSGSGSDSRSVGRGKMRTRLYLSLVIVSACFWPLTARADAGTPLLWANAFHLLIGNAIIGLFEGYVLAKVFKLPLRRCNLLLIAANYFSTWASVLLLSGQFHSKANCGWETIRSASKTFTPREFVCSEMATAFRRSTTRTPPFRPPKQSVSALGEIQPSLWTVVSSRRVSRQEG